jgi:arylsulfatase A-like enzyme
MKTQPLLSSLKLMAAIVACLPPAAMPLAGNRPHDVNGPQQQQATEGRPGDRPRGEQPPPNVLFIALDDLNDWIGCLGGHPQAHTPNMDRLAAQGMLFTNAHCPAPACNPSRTAVMTGLSPHRSGVYTNRQQMREILPDAELLPKYFSRHGYWAGGSGKILHYFIDASSWDAYYPAPETEDPFPRTMYPKHRPVSLPRGGPWQYIETDWGPLDATDEAYGGDWLVSKWVGEQLLRDHRRPFFLACGIYRPHEPWFVPQRYFDRFPLADIQLPPGYLEDDLDDLPPAGKRLGPNRYFAHIRKNGQWKLAIQGYLASIAFADAMVGRVLDALENGPHRDNTIVVLWSDHGWHLGEKQHWQKYTGWRACTRVPLIVRVPSGTPGLPLGTRPGRICAQPVNLLSLFPTLVDLAGLPPADSDGPSLVPLLNDPKAPWPHVSVTHLAEPGSYSMSALRWRYVHYTNGDEELYDTAADPFEWNNLAPLAKHQAVLAGFRTKAPTTFAPAIPPRDASLPALRWRAASAAEMPLSRPEGDPFDIVLINRYRDPVKLYVVDVQGKRVSRGMIASGWRLQRSTLPGSVWLVADTRDKPLGYFVVGDRSAQAVIPALAQE